MPSDLPTPRLEIMIARRARRAIVFRRGPSKRVQMVLWNLETDRVQLGQWLKGKIYVDKSDLSPDGKLLVYFAGKHYGKVPTFTAVSRPPYFTALLFYRNIGTYGGGGWFENGRHVVLCSCKPVDGKSNEPPPGMVVEHAGQGDSTLAGPQRAWSLLEKGDMGRFWDKANEEFDAPAIYVRPNPVVREWVLTKTWPGWHERSGPSRQAIFAVHQLDGEGRATMSSEHSLVGVDFAEWDHDGSLLFGRDGSLFRERFIGPQNTRFSPRRVAALTDSLYQAKPPPPEATQWPG